MGQRPSKHPGTRLAQIYDMKRHTQQLMDTWQERMFAELNVGAPGSATAVWEAALEHSRRLTSEIGAINVCLRG